LECTDFCAAAARSQQLSEALGSGGEKRTTPPGPVEYPSTLLDFYKDNKIWCTTIEETMRSFCADPAAKAKMFKPMRVELRQFVHELAEVYGLRSESLDEEPHRAVQISKTSGTFVPLTKLAHAVPASASALEQMKRPTQAYNAFVLLTLQFGLTSSELMEALKVESKLAFDCHFTPDSENAYLLPTEKSKAGMSPEQVEVELARLKPRFRQIVSKRELAGLLELCWLNKDGIMSYREGSRKKQIVRPVTAVTETGNTFSALMLNEASA
jgi:transcriptional repressor NF-X1